MLVILLTTLSVVSLPSACFRVNTAAIQPIHEHRALVNVHPATASARFMSHHNSSTTGSFHGGSSGGAPSPAPSGGGYRQSLHSSTSSLGSGSNATGAEVDSICALNIPEMVANGVAVSSVWIVSSYGNGSSLCMVTNTFAGP